MKKEVKIGIFAVAMILCAWGGIRFLSGIDIFSRNVDYYAAYDQINGVQGASPVIMRGVKVGTVSDILFDPGRDARVVLRLTVRRQYRIPADSEAKIVSSSLMGAKAIEIVLGESAEMLEKGDTIRSGYTCDLMETAMSELDFFKEKIARLTEELSRTLTGVSTVVEGNTANIQSTVAHLNSISGNLDEILSAEKNGLRSAIDGFSRFSQTLGDNAGRLDTLMGNLTRFSDSLAQADLKSSIARLDAILRQIEEGEGSVGKLMTDQELYDNLAQASGNLSLLLADLKENPMRYVHFSLFGRSESKERERAARAEAKAEEKRLKDSLKAIR